MNPEDKLALYQHLYEETLFVFPGKSVAPKQEEAISAADLALGDISPAIKYNLVGENRKGLIIVVSQSEGDFARLAQNEFLSKILTAIKFVPTDVAYLNMQAKGKLSVFDLAKHTDLKYLLVFGPGLLDMSADSKVSLYKPAGIGNIPLLITDPLPDIELDVNKKKWLWEGLKAIFLK